MSEITVDTTETLGASGTSITVLSPRLGVRMTERQKRLYEKYKVQRTDRRDLPGRKHDGCRYFVLDLDHDPYAIPALRTYAEVCAVAYPQLSADLRAWIEQLEQEE